MDRLKYNWERRAGQLLADYSTSIGGRFEIIGFAVENVSTGEGALIKVSELSDGIISADVWQDVKGDVDGIYNQAVTDLNTPPEAE